MEENFGVQVPDRDAAIELVLRKLWSNFLIVVDWKLYYDFLIEDGRSVAIKYVHERLDEIEDQEIGGV